MMTVSTKEVRENLLRALSKLGELEGDREKLLLLCREIIRLSRAIVAGVHSGKDVSAEVSKLRDTVATLRAYAQSRPELYFSGTVTSALTEYVEATSLYTLMLERRLPSLDEVGVEPAPYLLGIADLVGELRRSILEHIRAGSFDQAESLFEIMEALYDTLRQVSLPDALAPGLRRKTDIARALVENTRRDVIFFRRAAELEKALRLQSAVPREEGTGCSGDNS